MLTTESRRWWDCDVRYAIEWTPEGDRKGMKILSMEDGEKTSLTNDAYDGMQ